MRGIVTQVMSSSVIPKDKIIFMRDYGESIDFGEIPEGVIVFVPAGKPLLFDEALRMIGKPVDIP
jgi:hypothetical protein